MEQNENVSAGSTGEITSEQDPLAEMLRTVTEERDNLQDLLVRKQAEFENFRKRADKERNEWIQYASSELMRELLNVLDSFELALKDTPAGEGASVEDMRKGFELIHKQMLDTLTRFGLEPTPAVGLKFDPHVHQAVTTEATDAAGENTVLEELRKGYLIRGRLLRPAMVKVAVKS